MGPLGFSKLVALLILPVFIVPGVVGLKARLYVSKRSANYNRIDTIVYSWALSLLSLFIVYLGIHMLTGNFQFVPPVFEQGDNWDLEVLVFTYIIHFVLTSALGAIYGVFSHNLIEPARIEDRKTNEELLFEYLLPGNEVELQTTSGEVILGKVSPRWVDDNYENIILLSPTRIRYNDRGEIIDEDDLGYYHYIDKGEIAEISVCGEATLEQDHSQELDRIQTVISNLLSDENQDTILGIFSNPRYSVALPGIMLGVGVATGYTLGFSFIFGFEILIGESQLFQVIWLLFAYIFTPIWVYLMLRRFFSIGHIIVYTIFHILATIAVGTFEILRVEFVQTIVPTGIAGILVTTVSIIIRNNNRTRTGVLIMSIIPLVLMLNIVLYNSDTVTSTPITALIIIILFVFMLLYWEAVRGPPSRRLNSKTALRPILGAISLGVAYILIIVPVFVVPDRNVPTVTRLSLITPGVVTGGITWFILYLITNEESADDKEESTEELDPSLKDID